MKKLLISLVVLAAGFISCAQEELFNTKPLETSVTPITSFTIIEEKELTADQLFTEELNTRAIVPALYKTARIQYTTLDQHLQPVTVSALVVYPLLKRIKNVMLINHGTKIGPLMVPTQYTSIEGVMAATGSLCIMPDYIGMGASSSHSDPYMNAEVSGRTSVDALLTLLDYAKAKKLLLDSNYKSYILGYSQGGSVSLAALRQVQQLDAATQQRLHLQKVICGDGPYDLKYTFESYLNDFQEGKNIAHGLVVPTMINGMLNSYPEEAAAAGMKYESFFTDWALSTGIPQDIRNNKDSNLLKVLGYSDVPLDKILNMDYMAQYQNLLLEMMDRQNLCTGWAPQYKLQLLHVNPDGVVPFGNMERAYEGLNNENMLDPIILNVNPKLLDAMMQHVYGEVIFIEKVLLSCEL